MSHPRKNKRWDDDYEDEPIKPVKNRKEKNKKRYEDHDEEWDD